uniref:Transmembrane protein 135 N-terminal domain-containing protein n=1 Tax=Anopheles culicifacies TaxID=139723 RepID=A0A182MVF1_9DIPT
MRARVAHFALHGCTNVAATAPHWEHAGIRTLSGIRGRPHALSAQQLPIGMGQLSKHFRLVTVDKTCRDVLHPDQACGAAWCAFLVQGILGGIRHYLPAVVVPYNAHFVTPMVFRVRQWHEPEVWKNFLWQYARKCMGRFPPAWFVLIPSLAGGLTAQYLPRHIVRAQGIGLFNMYIEFLIRRARTPLVGYLRNSRLCATAIFALLSAGIMAARQCVQLERFWFARTYPDDHCDVQHVTQDGKVNLRPPTNCRQHIITAMMRSVYIALAVSLVKNFLPRMPMLLTDPLALGRLMLTRFDMGLFGFITCYKTIYEIVNCWLGTRPSPVRPSPVVRSALGGLCAGLAYYCFPNYLLFTFSITELAELCWLVYMRSERFAKCSTVRWLDSEVPVSILLYTASLGLLCHLRIVYPYHINRYWHKLMANGTWGRSDTLAYNYARILLGGE